MTAVWPLTLPQSPTPEGFAETPPDTSVRTQMDAGPAYVRRRSTAGVRPIQMQFIMEPEQIDILDDFYLQDCASGSLPFFFNHPRTGDQLRVRFTSPPQYSASGGLIWMALVSVEALPQ